MQQFQKSELNDNYSASTTCVGFHEKMEKLNQNWFLLSLRVKGYSYVSQISSDYLLF